MITYVIKSEREAVEITLSLWKYLHRYPQKSKIHWPQWEKKYGHMVCYCPLCEWDIEHGRNCSSCPLAGYWTGIPAVQECVKVGSPYDEWTDFNHIYLPDAQILRQKRKYSGLVIKLLEKWLKEA